MISNQYKNIEVFVDIILVFISNVIMFVIIFICTEYAADAITCILGELKTYYCQIVHEYINNDCLLFFVKCSLCLILFKWI